MDSIKMIRINERKMALGRSGTHALVSVFLVYILLLASCATVPNRAALREGNITDKDLLALQEMNQQKLDRDGYAPIHYLAMSGQFSWLADFVKKTHADTSLKTATGETAAELFIDSCKKRHPDFSVADGKLLMAIIGGKAGAVKELVEATSDDRKYYLSPGIWRRQGSKDIVYPYARAFAYNGIDTGAYASPLFYAVYLGNEDATSYLMDHLPPSQRDSVSLENKQVYREALEQAVIDLLDEHDLTRIGIPQVLDRMYSAYPDQREIITRAVFVHLQESLEDVLVNRPIMPLARYQLKNYRLLDELILPKVLKGDIAIPLEYLLYFGNPGMDGESTVLNVLRRNNFVFLSDAVILYFKNYFLKWESGAL